MALMGLVSVVITSSLSVTVAMIVFKCFIPMGAFATASMAMFLVKQLSRILGEWPLLLMVMYM